nr:hypothetical protein [Tanacetum cinerariifolium]
LDTYSSVRRPKNSGVMWKKKGSSNTYNVGLFAVSVLNLNKNVKRYSRKDLLASLEAKATPVEESTGVLESMFSEVEVSTDGFADFVICEVRLICWFWFFGVTATGFVPSSVILGQGVFSGLRSLSLSTSSLSVAASSRELASPKQMATEQTATGKENSNSFMADSLPINILNYVCCNIAFINGICIDMDPFEFLLIYLVVTSVVLALEQLKTAQDLVIKKLQKKVKKIKRKIKARTPGMTLFKISNFKRKSLDKENTMIEPNEEDEVGS